MTYDIKILYRGIPTMYRIKERHFQEKFRNNSLNIMIYVRTYVITQHIAMYALVKHCCVAQLVAYTYVRTYAC